MTRLERQGLNALRQFEVYQIDGLVSAMSAGQELKALVRDKRSLSRLSHSNPDAGLAHHHQPDLRTQSTSASGCGQQRQFQPGRGEHPHRLRGQDRPGLGPPWPDDGGTQGPSGCGQQRQFQPGRGAHPHCLRGQNRPGLGPPWPDDWRNSRAIRVRSTAPVSARTGSASSPPQRTKPPGYGTAVAR